MSSLKSDILINPQDLYDVLENNANDATSLGQRAVTGDGREFRFAQAGATTLVPGTLLQAPAQITGNEGLSVTATAIGATSVTTSTSVTVTANQYAGGWLQVTSSAGAGYSYQIGSHPATTSAALTLQLVDPIVVALTTSSTVDLASNPYLNVIINPTTATSCVVGVAIAPATSGFYTWIQVCGTGLVLAQGAIVVGEQVAASSTTAGAVVATSGVLASAGIAQTSITSTNYGSIYITLP